VKRRRFVKPLLETLEDRCTPAVWGIPWTDGSHLTVSFVPDGTKVDGTTSVLSQMMSRDLIPQAVWQGQILQAFQAWENVTNVNFRVVPDNGAPLGAPGAPQGDNGFGDIRIAAIPMSSDVLALTTAPGPLTGTRGGDIVFNSNDFFTAGGGLLGTNYLPLLDGVIHQDLYTVAQHEIGHALGLPDNNDPTSIMYGKYDSHHSTLDAVDVSNIQALYGTPAPDAFTAAGATSLATAWLIQPPPSAPAYVNLSVAGDLTTSTDVNYFQFNTGSTNPNGVALQLNTSDQSLLAGRISVYNSNQQLLATATAAGSGQNLTLSLNNVSNNSTYYVKVDRPSGTPFAVGAYQLNVVFGPNAPTVAALGSNAPLDNDGANATLGTALALQTTAGYTANTHYAVSAIADSASNVDVYSFQSATPPAGQPNVMTLSVQTLSGGPAPTLAVYDSNQQPVAAQILDNCYGNYSIQVANAQAGATYYVAVSASPGTPPASVYRLAISFCSQTATLQVDAQGTLSQGNNTAGGQISVTQSQQRFFTLTAAGGSSAAWVTMTIYNLQGQVVGSLTAQPGQTVSSVILLNEGDYTVGITAGTDDDSVLAPTNYVLSSVAVSSPIGATLSNTGQASGSGTTAHSSGGSYTYNQTKYPASPPT
jgi:Matrixin